MNQIDYIYSQNGKVDKFVSDIKKKKIVVNKWIRLAVNRYEKDLKRKDLVLRQDKVDHVFRFFSNININIKNRYSQFDLLPYQAFIVKNLFLFYYNNGKRRYRYSFLFISRKSGKTVFATALDLYFLVGDGVQDPQCLLLASTREQATIALDYAKSIVQNSPFLKRIDNQRYELKFNHKNSRGFMKTLASNANRLDGYSPSSAILDEIHSYPDDSLFKVVKSGILARKNPMIMMISTAGFMINSFCYEMLESSKNILLGNVKDDSFFSMLFTLDDNDDYNDPKCWIKSNPSIGTTIDIEDLKIEFNQAQIRPSEMSNFKTKNLNLFVEMSVGWIDDEVLKKSFYKNKYKLNGLSCYAGIDLSSTRDLTSLVLLFEVDGKFIVESYFFMANNPDKRQRKGGVNLDRWISNKNIILCKTKTIDYDLIFETIKSLSIKYNIININYDQFNSALLIPKIEDLNINCTNFKQTAMSFNFPLKFLEKQMYDENICMSDNPVLLWNFRNIVLYIDGNGNIKIVKNKSLDSVDGAVALGMSFAGWIADNLDEERMSLETYLNKS